MQACEPGIEVLKNHCRNGYCAVKFWMPHLGKLIFARVTAHQIHDEVVAEKSATLIATARSDAMRDRGELPQPLIRMSFAAIRR